MYTLYFFPKHHCFFIYFCKTHAKKKKLQLHLKDKCPTLRASLTSQHQSAKHKKGTAEKLKYYYKPMQTLASTNDRALDSHRQHDMGNFFCVFQSQKSERRWRMGVCLLFVYTVEGGLYTIGIWDSKAHSAPEATHTYTTTVCLKSSAILTFIHGAYNRVCRQQP